MTWSRRETLLGLGAALATGCAGRRSSEVVVNDNVAMDGPAIRAGTLHDLLVEHAGRYPRMEPQDLYKLCHHRAMGPGHLVAAGDALAWLQREAAELAPLPAGVEAVDVELLNPGRGLARLHLRPWLAQGRSLEALATAFAESAARWSPAPDVLSFELGAVSGLLEGGALALGFDRAAWEAFAVPLMDQGLPAEHHSEVYRESYAPAYRVVLVELIAGAG